MNEDLQKQLIRQMKILNFWITFFGTLGIIALVVLAIIAWQLVSFIGETNNRIDSVRQQISESTDLRGQACSEGSSLRKFLDNTGACE